MVSEPEQTPLVSVIVPTYNGTAFLRETLNSVLAQTYPSVELIVVNDGSTDDTVDLLAEYCNRISVITKVNGGTSAARNTGVQCARGAFFAFLDHDDLWAPTKLERQMALFLEFPDAGIIYCGRQFFDHYTGRITSVHRAEPSIDIHYLLGMEAIALQSVVIPRHVIDEVGLFDESISGADDWEMCIRISAKYEVCGVPDVLVDIRGHEHQQSTQTEQVYEKILMVLARYKDVHTSCEECRAAAISARIILHEGFYQRMLASSKAAFRSREYLKSARLLLRGLREQPAAITRIPKRILQRISGGAKTQTTAAPK